MSLGTLSQSSPMDLRTTILEASLERLSLDSVSISLYRTLAFDSRAWSTYAVGVVNASVHTEI